MFHCLPRPAWDPLGSTYPSALASTLAGLQARDCTWDPLGLVGGGVTQVGLPVSGSRIRGLRTVGIPEGE